MCRVLDSSHLSSDDRAMSNGIHRVTKSLEARRALRAGAAPAAGHSSRT